jgi:hypothetical protein
MHDVVEMQVTVAFAYEALAHALVEVIDKLAEFGATPPTYGRWNRHTCFFERDERGVELGL